eukprot:4291040-Prymnesium_polylepis.1
MHSSGVLHGALFRRVLAARATVARPDQSDREVQQRRHRVVRRVQVDEASVDQGALDDACRTVALRDKRLLAFLPLQQARSQIPEHDNVGVYEECRVLLAHDDFPNHAELCRHERLKGGGAVKLFL